MSDERTDDRDDSERMERDEYRLLRRRSVLVASAWAVPVLTLAVAAPAAAASPGDVSQLDFLSTEVGDGANLIGRALDATGAGVAGIVVSFQVVSGPLLIDGDPFSATDSNGYFYSPLQSTLAAGAEPEQATVLVTAGSLASQSVVVTVLPD